MSPDAFRRLALLFGSTVYAAGLGAVLVFGGWPLALGIAAYGFVVAVALTIEPTPSADAGSER